MKIITAPHQTLRAKAAPITKLDNKTIKFLNNLKKTLDKQRNPTGVGLAGNQVNKKLRAFAIREINADKNQVETVSIQVIINPKIIKHSESTSLGRNEEEPDLEGCLSVPQIYGPVPRWDWVELEFQIMDNDSLVDKKKRFTDYPARVVQHELDHLNGILFTDHLLEHDLPAYIQENGELEKLEPRSILKVY